MGGSGRGARVRARAATRPDDDQAVSAGADPATVDLETFHNVRADLILRGRLVGEGGGRYACELPMRRNGRWELRFEVHRGDEQFTAVVADHFTVAP